MTPKPSPPSGVKGRRPFRADIVSLINDMSQLPGLAKMVMFSLVPFPRWIFLPSQTHHRHQVPSEKSYLIDN